MEQVGIAKLRSLQDSVVKNIPPQSQSSSSKDTSGIILFCLGILVNSIILSAKSVSH